jgi:hypothetical protein
MSEQEHINKGFLKDKLGNYQVDPPEKVWEAVSGQIGQGRKRRGFYIILLATAASIALAISLGIYFFGPDLTGEASLVEEEDQLKQEQGRGKPADGVTSEPVPEPKPVEAQEGRQILAMEEVPESKVPEIRQTREISDSEFEDGTRALDEADGDADQETAENREISMEEDADSDRDTRVLPDTVPEMDMVPVPVMETEMKRKSRWMVGAAVSPLYSYRDAESAAIPPDQAETGLLSYSTGVHVRYRRNSRFAIETGIYYNRTGIAIGAPGIKIFSQQHDNMLFGVGSESADIKTVSNSVGNIVAYSGDIFMNGYKISAENAGDALASGALTDVRLAESGIQQHLDYLEVPLNLRYSVIDRTFELQLVGGVSTNFLVGNSVTMESSSGREEIGYLSNVNTVNYSGNAGLGMIYHMGRKMSLFLEPRFRYFLNSVNDASLPATRPYSLGFYTGLSYTF